MPTPTPTPLDEVVQDHRYTLDRMWHGAMADRVITHDEAVKIYEYQTRHYDPAVTKLTLTVGMVSSMLRGSDGMFGPRARRNWRELSERVSNLVPFRGRGDLSGDVA